MSPVETKFCPLLKVIWAMEWNLSSLPDANFAGEEWRNLHRNCVPIASLENLEFSSVLLRFPFFFFSLAFKTFFSNRSILAIISSRALRIS